MQRVAADPELRGRVEDVAFRPVTGVGDDDGESFAVVVRDGGEGVPFEKRPVREFDPVEWSQALVSEVQAGGVVGEHFRKHFMLTESAPG